MGHDVLVPRASWACAPRSYVYTGSEDLARASERGIVPLESVISAVDCMGMSSGSRTGQPSGPLNSCKDEMKAQCKKKFDTPRCVTPKINASPFCEAMNKKTMYKGASPDYISTWNPVDWDKTTGTIPAPVACDNGGTFTNCFSAACYKGSPTSPFLKGIGLAEGIAAREGRPCPGLVHRTATLKSRGAISSSSTLKLNFRRHKYRRYRMFRNQVRV